MRRTRTNAVAWPATTWVIGQMRTNRDFAEAWSAEGSDPPPGDQPGVHEPRRPLASWHAAGRSRVTQKSQQESRAVPECPLPAYLGPSLPICALEQAEVRAVPCAPRV